MNKLALKNLNKMILNVSIHVDLVLIKPNKIDNFRYRQFIHTSHSPSRALIQTFAFFYMIPIILGDDRYEQ